MGKAPHFFAKCGVFICSAFGLLTKTCGATRAVAKVPHGSCWAHMVRNLRCDVL